MDDLIALPVLLLKTLIHLIDATTALIVVFLVCFSLIKKRLPNESDLESVRAWLGFVNSPTDEDTDDDDEDSKPAEAAAEKKQEAAAEKQQGKPSAPAASVNEKAGVEGGYDVEFLGRRMRIISIAPLPGTNSPVTHQAMEAVFLPGFCNTHQHLAVPPTTVPPTPAEHGPATATTRVDSISQTEPPRKRCCSCSSECSQASAATAAEATAARASSAATTNLTSKMGTKFAGPGNGEEVESSGH